MKGRPVKDSAKVQHVGFRGVDAPSMKGRPVKDGDPGSSGKYTPGYGFPQ